jgi:transposase InsO family protein
MHPSHTDKRKLKHAIEVISTKRAHMIFVPKNLYMPKDESKSKYPSRQSLDPTGTNSGGTSTNRKGIRVEYIQPGKPQQNAYVERFNRTVRYEWLAQYCFDAITEVQDFATRWIWNYNHERPNMALGGIAPKQRLAMAA